MAEVTDYKYKDKFTGKLLKPKTLEELSDMLAVSYAGLTEGQRQNIISLCVCIETDDEHGIKWYGVACDLEITPIKKARKRTNAK